MHVKSQPWIHSWYGDFFGLHFIPILFAILALFRLPPFREINAGLLEQLVFAVLIIDWAHIFAQWYRIYSNPAEKLKTKYIYLFSYLLLIPVITLALHFDTRMIINRFLIYFVVFHFIKQSFGFIKIYSRIDGIKTKFESYVETTLIYSAMVCPVIYWHVKFPKPDFTWAYFFLKSPVFSYLVIPAFTLYGFCLILYVSNEYKRWKTKQIFNVPKNLALAAAAIGWGAISLLPESKLLIMFTVVLTHDMAYTVFVWYIGRRDTKIQTSKVSWFSWWSVPGFFLYVIAIIAVSHPIMVLHLEMARNAEMDYWMLGKIFNNAPYSGWWQNFGFAIFFATQGHHYFIDKYLWKKEKDLAYLVHSGQMQVGKAA